MDKAQLKSCDTFVCLPPLTKANGNGGIIFGKNSDRPAGEVQEIVYFPEKGHVPGSQLKCTYIEIDQVPLTASVVLSKPSWMWGAEMGANQYGVCIGNEAVWTKLNSPSEDIQKRLLGMDLVRLGLERGKTAREALNVITELLEKYGQGGSCSETMRDFTYHNSFLIADVNEAWVLETAGQLWAAEHVTSGFRHISNELSIGSKIDLACDGLQDIAEALGLWKRGQDFHFTKVFSDGGGLHESLRVTEGRRLLKEATKGSNFDVKSMMNILRDEGSGICMSYDDSFQSTSSQVSLLHKPTNNFPKDRLGLVPLCCHWFTGTPDPKVSVFKPFFFPPDDFSQDQNSRCRIQYQFTESTTSPSTPQPHQSSKRSSSKLDRRHLLYKTHEAAYHSKMSKPVVGENLLQSMKQLENNLLEQAEAKLNTTLNALSSEEVNDLGQLFGKAVQLELELYR